MPTTNDAKHDKMRILLTLLGLMAIALLTTGTASARGNDFRPDLDRRFTPPPHVVERTVTHRRTSPARRATRVERRHDRPVAIVHHPLDFIAAVATVAAVATDYPFVRVPFVRSLDRHDDYVVKHVRTVEHRHGRRHHDDCGHARSGHRGKHDRRDFRGRNRHRHDHGHGKGHGKGHR